MKQRVTIKVVGKVQGVFFRSKTKEKAEKLGLKGFVRNKKDGTVLIVAEGKKSDLQGLVNFAKEGSEYARVEKIEASYSEAKGKFNNFEVRRRNLFGLFFMI